MGDGVLQLIVRGSEEPELLAQLSPFLLTKKSVREWPGTVLHSDEIAVAYRYRIEEKLLGVLEQFPPLTKLLSPIYPEDPSLFRPDLSLWFGSITHEKDLFLEITHEEAAKLKERINITLQSIEE